MRLPKWIRNYNGRHRLAALAIHPIFRTPKRPDPALDEQRVQERLYPAKER